MELRHIMVFTQGLEKLVQSKQIQIQIRVRTANSDLYQTQTPNKGGLLGPQPLPWAVFPRPTPAWQGMKKGYTIPPTHTQCKITCKLEPCISVTPPHDMQTIFEPSG